MTFNREMLKALKEYLTPLGFKYKAKDYVFLKIFNDDISYSIRYADENRSRPRYYFLKIAVGVVSKHLDEILKEATNGLEDFTEYNTACVYICNCRDWNSLSYEDKLKERDWIHCEFIGDRPMEENLADFDRMYREDVQTIFDKYSTQKAIFLCPITDPYWNKMNTPDLWLYVPLAYYFNGEFDKAFAYIDERIGIEEENEESAIKRGYILNDDSTRPKRAYMAMRKNLKKWIEEKRTFQVDDEYLPKF